MCGKLKISSDLALKTEPSKKFDIHLHGFLTETVCNPQYKLKVTKSNFYCIHIAHRCKAPLMRYRVP